MSRKIFVQAVLSMFLLLYLLQLAIFILNDCIYAAEIAG